MKFRRRQSLADLKKQHKRRQRSRRHEGRELRLERLEDRRLLAGPELFAIRPDQGPLLQADDVLNVAPREFNLLFKGGAEIDPATISGNVQLIRSNHDGVFGDGDDVTVDLGFVGLRDPSNLNQIVLRPASQSVHNLDRPQSSLPDDRYRLQVIGTGASPLANIDGDAFNNGANFNLDFTLNLGAQVISLVPQPVSRNTQRITITGAAGSFTLNFGGQITAPIVLPSADVAADIKTALEALSNVQANDISVTDTSAANVGPWDVDFQGQFAGEQVSPLVAAGTGLTANVTQRVNLSQARDQIVVYLNNDPLDPSNAVDPKFYRLVNTAATAAADDDTILLPQQVTYDQLKQKAVLTFANDIPDGTYRLDIGVADEANGSPTDAIRIGTLFMRAGDDFSYVGFLGDIGGLSTDTGDQDWYRANLDMPATVDVRVEPQGNLDVIIEVFGSDGSTPIGAPEDTNGEGLADMVSRAVPAGNFFVKVSSDTGNPLNAADSYRISINVNDPLTPIGDDNSSFITATNLGVLGAAGQQISSTISPQGIALPEFPGSVDEPGHRDIQGEQHISDDVNNTIFDETVVPNAITTRSYYFGDIYGSDSFGNLLTNQISEGQKELTRQIFEIYSAMLGIEFVEVTNGTVNDIQVVTGSIAAVTNASITGVYGVSRTNAANFPTGHLVALMDASSYAGDDEYGGGWFVEAMRQIGSAIANDQTPWLNHSFDVLSIQGPGVSVPTGSAQFPGDPAYAGPIGEPVFPGDHDLVHHRREQRPDSTDIDLFRFQVTQPGWFSAEITAQRPPKASLLNSVLTLFDSAGKVVAQNDDYFSKDSFIGSELDTGTYFIGVTSTGNSTYDPNVSDTGFGGVTQGDYDLSLEFKPDAKSSLRDATGVAADGDADGVPGGVLNFWFQSSSNTIFVDKANDQRANLVDGNGQLTGTPGNPNEGPFDTLEFALTQAGSRIVAPDPAGIADGDRFVVDDGTNPPVTFEFNKVGGLPPNGVDLTAAATAIDVATQIEAAINASALAGITVTRTGNVVQLGGIQSLDVSQTEALLTAPNIVRIVGNGGFDRNINTLGDNDPYLLGLDNSNIPTEDGAEFLVPQGVTAMLDAGTLLKLRRANLDAGTSSTGVDRQAGAIQLLGVPGRPVLLRSLRDDSVGGDSDGVGPAPIAGDYGGVVFRDDSDMEDRGVFLNWVNHADIQRGGGKVPVESREEVFTPVHMIVSRPTISHNRITRSAGAAISADPNSFQDQDRRIGPEIHSNTLIQVDATGTVFDNSINGLFIRIETQAGSPVDKLTEPARFDDDDIPHVITENLLIAGNPGGQRDGTPRLSGRLQIDPGVVVKLDGARIEAERGASSLIAEGNINGPVTFTSVKDDRYGGSATFNTDRGTTSPAPGDWGGLVFNALSRASFDHVLITYAGGQTPIEGDFSVFNAVEAHQAKLRLTNSVLENNASGRATGTRNGRGTNTDAVIFVRGAQPIIVDNIIRDNNLDRLGNATPANAISINASALNSEVLRDYGRSTGRSDRFEQFADNHGPLVRLNRLANNGTNGMEVRAALLTTESVWDDTSIVHVVRDEIMVDNHHTFSGLRLQSSSTESLVVKFRGTNAGLTASGRELDIDDRIGGSIQILGAIGHPVILTSLADDSAGAGFTPDGHFQTDTDNVQGTPMPGNWRSVKLDKFSNDRNVAVVNELEDPFTDANDVNRTTASAENLGRLAPNLKSGDENRRLGLQVHGTISRDDPADEDVYSFTAVGGTRVWIDLDRTHSALNATLQLINITGNVTATSFENGALAGTAQTMNQNTLFGEDYYTLNRLDPGMSVVLPGTGEGTYFVRVLSDGPTIVDSPTRSIMFNRVAGGPDTITVTGGSFLAPGQTFAAGQRLVVRGSVSNDGDYLIDTVTAGTITLAAGEELTTEAAPTGTRLRSNLTSGEYQLQVRLQQRDEKPGSTIRFADIRYAATGIEVRGLPAHSNLLGETGENGDAGNTAGAALDIGNVLASDRSMISIGGRVNSQTDVDWFQFTLDHDQVENATENSSGLKTVALVFDIDYADGLTRPDTTIAIFNSANELVYIGRESHVQDDQPAGAGTEFDDLTRGTVGNLDPFIGPIHLPVGFVGGNSLTYRVAVMSNRMIPNAIAGFFLSGGGTAANRQNLRLEPANGVQRIVEDHIGGSNSLAGGYTSGTPLIDTISFIENRFEVSPQSRNIFPDTPRIFRTENAATLNSHVLPFTLADVRLYVSTDNDLFSYDPFNGDDKLEVSDNALQLTELQDIAFRTDGRLFGYRRQDVDSDPADGDFNNEVGNTAGELIELSPANGAISGNTNDGIRGPLLTMNNPIAPALYRHDITLTDQVDAVTFRRDPADDPLPDAPRYDIFYAVRDPNVPGGASKLFFDDNDPADVADGVVGGIPGDDEDTDDNGALIGYIGATKGFANTDMNGATIGFFPNDVGLASNGITLNIVQDPSDPAADPVNQNVVRVTGGFPVITATIRHNNGANNVSAQALVDAINAFLDGTVGIAAIMDNDGGVRVSDNPPATPPLIVGGRSITTAGGTRTLVGVTTGLAFVDTDNDGDGDQLFGVTDRGEIFRINTLTPSDTFFPTAAVTLLKPAGAENFQGLAVGPQNLRDPAGNTPGFYRQMLFAVEANGRLHAFNTAGTPQAVFAGGNTQLLTSVSGVTGLAFSPLDFNLWHPTHKRGLDAGHGINNSIDHERRPGLERNNFGPNQTNDSNGNQSFYFGLEVFDDQIEAGEYKYQPYVGTTQLGLQNNLLHNDLTFNPLIGENYDLPGGALGSLVSSTFSLQGYSSEDKPTLYVDYFLETQGAAGGPHPVPGIANPDRSMRDSARVFISNDGINWDLLATNNSTLSQEEKDGDDDAELSTFISHSAIANFTGGDAFQDGRTITEQQVQELFDNTGVWRQVRVDLHQYAGQNNLRLRFDFSTAGDMDQGLPGDRFGVFEDADVSTNFVARQRGQNNNFEGFYIDDIIVGFSERGEMVTGASADVVPFDLESNSRTDFPDPTAPARHLTGDYQLEIRRAGEYANIITGLRENLLMKTGFPYDTNDRFILETAPANSRRTIGDRNVERQQGQLIIDSNMVSNSALFGIDIAADRVGNRPYPGSVIRFDTQNPGELYPGAVVQNNIVSFFGSGGIRFAGQAGTPANAPVPFGRIVNNSIYGGNAQTGTGVLVENNASPTILNNIFANTSTAIRNGAGNNTLIIGSNLFHNNGSPTGPAAATAGSNPLFQIDGDPLFADPDERNFYLEAGSLAIDSSLNSLQDRLTFANFKAELGIPQSPIFAPDRDVFGQLRVDDPNEDPLGGGSAIFKDRGAVDRADDEQPFAELILPVDNDGEGLDLDPNDTIVQLEGVFLDTFSIFLGDGPGPNSPFQGTGVDPLTVDDPADDAVSMNAVRVSRNGVPLVEDVDYTLGYSANNNVLLLTPLSSLWEPNSVYFIQLENTQVKDLAGNRLRRNQPSGKTNFTIILGAFDFDFGDVPDFSYGTLLASDGARHVQLPNAPLFLGSRVDTEADGQPVVRADGRNHADGDDADQFFDFGSSVLVQVPAVGSTSFQVPLTGGAGIPDGEFLTIDDDGIGPNLPVTFEFDLNGSVVPPIVPIDYFAADPFDLMASRIVSAVNGAALPGVVAQNLGGGFVHITRGAGSTVDLGNAPSLAVSNRLPIGVQVPAAGVADTQTFSISDGNNPTLTFEFEDASGAVGLTNLAHIPVGFDSATSTPAQIAASMALAIQGEFVSGRLAGLTVNAVGDTVDIQSAGGPVGDDEEGVTFGKLFLPGDSATGTWRVDVVASGAGKLDAWIDFNQNGRFNPTAEKLPLNGVDTSSVDVVAGLNSFTFDIGLVAGGVAVLEGLTYGRFRVSQAGGLFPTLLGIGGEVEDHELRVLSNTAPFVANSFNALAAAGSLLATDLDGDQILDLDEDQLHDAVAPGVDIRIDLENVGGLRVFDDIDISNGNGDLLVYSIFSNDNPTLVTPSLNGSVLDLNFLQDQNGMAQIVVQATDQAGLFVQDTLMISVRAINDDPFNAGGLPSDVTVTEDVTSNVNLSLIDLQDVDAAAGSLTVTLATVTGGRLFATGTALVNVGGSGTITLTLDGQLADLNNFLNGASNIRYLSVQDANGDDADMIDVLVNDNGNTGVGGSGNIALGTVNVDITAINDPPTNTGFLPGPLTVLEDVTTNIDLSAIDLSDVDALMGDLTLTLATGSGGTLSAVSGGGVTVGPPAPPTNTLILTGQLGALNAFLNGGTNIQYRGPLNVNGNGADTIGITVNDNGNTGMGGGLDVSLGVITVNITPVNDPPTNDGSLPTDVTVLEDVVSPVDLSQLDLQDVDAGGSDLTLTITADFGGTLFATAAAGVTIGGSGTGSLTISGPVAALNAFLDGPNNIEYLSVLNVNGQNADRLTVEIRDNAGSGDILLGMVNVDITAVNDAPTNNGTLPADVTVTEDVATDIDLSQIDLADVDVLLGTLTVTLSTGTGGTLFANSGGGVTVGGTGSNMLTLTGQLGALNNFLNLVNNIQYLSALHANGPAADTIIVEVRDNGNTGMGGGGDVLLGTITVNIDPINDPPRNGGTLPMDVTVIEDVVSDVSLGQIDIQDVDAGSGILTVTLSTSTGGRLFATSASGVTAGGSGTNTLTLDGQLGALNAFLDGASRIRYLSALNANGNDADTIMVQVRDNGNTGFGGGGNVPFGTVNVDITAVNDPPQNGGNLPGDQIVTEDVLTGIDLSVITIQDVDANGSNLSVKLSTTAGGRLSATSGAGVNVTGSNSPTLTLTGQLAALNTFLDVPNNVQFLSALNANGDNADTIVVTVNDNAGSGDVLFGNINVDILPVNDDPRNIGTLPANVTVLEDVNSGVDIGDIDLQDVDAAGGMLRMTLSTTAGGTLSATSGGGVTAGAPGTTLTLDGMLGALNAFLDGATNIRYLGLLNVNGNNADSINITINDNNNTGAGGGLDVNLGTVNVNITAVNDNPVNNGSLPATLTVLEDVASDINLSQIDIADVDVGLANITVRLSTSTGGTLSASGGGGVTVGGSSTNTLTLSGPLAAVNTFLDGPSNIRYLSALNANGNNADTITVRVNDNGNTGQGGGLDVVFGIVNVNITPVNDPPTNAGSLPTDVIVLEDVNSNVNLSAIDLRDVDAGLGNLTVTLSTGAGGTLFASPSGGVTVGGSTTSTLTLNGTLAALNNFLNTIANIQYRSALNVNGDNADTITVRARDNGNTGQGGGGDVNFGTVNVDITAVNDDPVNTGTLPSDIGVTEDVLSDVNLSPIDITDVDANGGNMTFRLSTSAGGRLVAASGGGVTVTGSGTTALTLNGTRASLNTFLNLPSNVGYLGVQNVNGNDADTILVRVNDNGNSGMGGGADVAFGIVNVDITAVNDDPLIAPAALAVMTNEDVPFTFNAANAALISVTDVDEDEPGGGDLKVTLAVSHGRLALATLANLANVTGNNTAAVMFEGSEAAVNAALNGLVYTPDQHYNSVAGGPEALVVTVNDQGNTGMGGGGNIVRNVPIDVKAINDDPQINPAVLAVMTNEDTPFTFNAANNALIDITDVDEDEPGGGTLGVTLGVSHGRLTLASTANLQNLNGNNSANVSFQGAEADVRAALNGLLYTPDNNYNSAAGGPETLVVTATDQGNTGQGGGGNVVRNVPIDVKAVNDAPTVNVPGAQSLDEGTDGGPLNSVTMAGFSVGDIDAAEGGPVRVTLSVPAGQGTVSVDTNVAGGAGSISGNNTPSLQLIGTVNQINNTLAAGVTYTVPNDDFNRNNNGGDVILTANINDQGNTGSEPNPPGFLEATAQVAISVLPVNDPPDAMDVNAAAMEDGAAVQFAFDADDVDLDDNPGTLTYLLLGSPSEGRVDNNGDGTFTFDPETDFQDLAVGEVRVVSFDYKATDSNLVDSLPATIRVAVQGSNDVSMATGDTFSAARNGTLVVDAPGVLENDTDIDGDVLQPVLKSGPTSGALDLRVDGSFTFTPAPDFTGLVSFTYAASDGLVESNQVTVNIQVTFAPVAQSFAVKTLRDGRRIVNILANAADQDGNLDPASIEIVAGPTNGTAVVNANGTVTYTPDVGFVGMDGFSYTIDDDLGVTSNVAQVSIQVNVPHPWQNPQNPLDVNANGQVSPLDILLILNELNRAGARELPNPPLPNFSPPPFYDVNGDEFITSGDILIVLNFLNASVQAEGESAAAGAAEHSLLAASAAADGTSPAAALAAASAEPFFAVPDRGPTSAARDPRADSASRRAAGTSSRGDAATDAGRARDTLFADLGSRIRSSAAGRRVVVDDEDWAGVADQLHDALAAKALLPDEFFGQK